MVMTPLAISASDLSVEYISQKGIISPKRSVEFRALREIDFSISQSEIVALLGRNGAGKSTLLKTISGMVKPSAGQVITNGRVIVLAGADPGFIPGISGRKNVEELGLAYGIQKDEMEAFSKSIEEFAQLGGAYDRDYRGYSTGMKGKLGFGFITSLRPEILLIDETLGVGDREFRAKAQMRLREFIERTGTVIISTHSLGLAKELCSRGIVLDCGSIYYDGEIEGAIREYSELTN